MRKLGAHHVITEGTWLPGLNSRMRQVKKPPQPPQALPSPATPLLSPLQWVGLPLLILLPVLAIVGVLGTSLDQVSAANGAVRLQVQYPARARKGTQVDARIRVLNAGSAPLGGVTVAIDRAYLDGFGMVKITPSDLVITDAGYEVSVGDLPAGASRHVLLQLEPGRSYGRRTGTVSVYADGVAQPVTVPLATFTFP